MLILIHTEAGSMRYFNKLEIPFYFICSIEKSSFVYIGSRIKAHENIKHFCKYITSSKVWAYTLSHLIYERIQKNDNHYPFQMAERLSEREYQTIPKLSSG